jgi:hypothetical protein
MVHAMTYFVLQWELRTSWGTEPHWSMVSVTRKGVLNRHDYREGEDRLTMTPPEDACWKTERGAEGALVGRHMAQVVSLAGPHRPSPEIQQEMRRQERAYLFEAIFELQRQLDEVQATLSRLSDAFKSVP